MVIVYCEVCGIRVSESDLQSGTALKSEEKFYCPKCTASKKLSLPPVTATRESRRMSPAPAPATVREVPHETRAHPPASGRHHADSARNKGSPVLLIAVGAAVVAVILGLSLRSRTEPQPAKKETTIVKASGTIDPAPQTKPTPEKSAVLPSSSETEKGSGLLGTVVEKRAVDDKEMESIRINAASKRLEEAKKFYAAQPQKAAAYRKMLTDLISTYRATPSADEAAKLLAELKVPETPAPVAKSSAAEDGNLVRDPGLESGALGVWTVWNSGGKIVADNARTGKFCARAGPGAGQGVRQILEGLMPGTTYELSAWVKVTEPTDNAALLVKDFGGKEIREPVTSTEYVEKRITFVTGKGDTKAKIMIFNENAKGFIYGDDFRVVKVEGR